MHRYNTQAVILTAQCHLISVLEVTKLFLTLYFSFSFFPHKCRSPAPPQKLCIKCTAIKNQKSAVIALFEITIIKINYNLRFKSFIHFISILTESL